MNQKIIPVILCGGSGGRLWPASRKKKPKQFLKLINDRSLLQNTARRALGVIGAEADNMIAVTLAPFADAIRYQLSQVNPALGVHILREPEARNTAAAVAYAAGYAKKIFGPECVLWVLPADHHIEDERALALSYEKALDAAKKGYLATFGICPTRPDTGYGYIQLSDQKQENLFYQARSFAEKPDAETAAAYIASGDYAWNSGMFMFSAETVLEEYRIHAPKILARVRHIVEQTMGAGDRYASIPSQSFDKAIMEHSSRVAVTPCDAGWSDIGSWRSIWELAAKDARGNALDGETVCAEARNCLVRSEKRLIALAGVEGLAVVDSGDALLIADMRNENAMRELVKTMETVSRPEVIDKTVEIPAKAIENATDDSQNYGVRDFTISSGEFRGFEAHQRVLCFLTAKEGQGYVAIGRERTPISRNGAVFIPPGAPYGVFADRTGDLSIIEVVQGAKMPNVAMLGARKKVA